ncbi:ArsR family transcriptional regulator [Halomicroarcula sp. GCM10025709]
MNDSDSRSKVSLDTLLSLMADKYRRRLLLALLEHNPQDDEDTQVPADVSLEDEELADLQVHMTHTHLPKLVDAGVIEWNEAESAVRKGPKFDELRPLLNLMRNHADELPDDWI